MRPRIKLYAAISAFCLATPAMSGAQAYDPTTHSPLRLAEGPKDPLAYRDARLKARALVAQGKVAEAEPLAEWVTREYPRDGENWLLLGKVKRSLKKYAEAASAFEKAGGLLRWGGEGMPGVGAAISHVHAGNKRAALDRIRHYIAAEGRRERSWLYDEDDFVSLKSDPEFLEIAGRPDTSGWSRDDGWRRDLDYLRGEVKRLNDEPTLPELDRRYQELRQKIPQLSDEEILVGMSRMLAVLGQGHTNITTPSSSRIAPKGLPVQLWVFPEGIFVVDATDQHKDLIGSRLISIDGVPAEEALRKINATQSVDGDNMYINNGPQRLRSMPFLVGLGIAKSSDSARLELQRPAAPKRTIAVSTAVANFSVELVPPPGAKAPLYLQDLKQFHWHQALPEQDALYVQLNDVSDEKDETLHDYGLRLRGVLAEAAPKNLILDMRHNGGGSTHLYAEFLRTMIGHSLLPGRRLYVLISRNTYSAAGNLLTELEQLAGAVILGEPSSECCTFYGSPSTFTLPFSKLAGRLSTRRWSLSRKPDDFRREMIPHVPVQLTAKDYFAGRDPVMETLLRVMERDRAPKPTTTH